MYFIGTILNLKDINMDALTLQILGLFENTPARALTIHNVSKLLKRTYPFVYKKVNTLIKENILNRKIVGRTHEVWPNLKNEQTILYFALNSQSRKTSFLKRNLIQDALQELTSKIRSHGSIKSIILFGSHTKGKETKKSDVDILVITSAKSSDIDQFVLSAANTVSMTFGCQINTVIVDDGMFQEMLINPEELNVGKEVLKAHVILYGFEHFWTILGGKV